MEITQSYRRTTEYDETQHHCYLRKLLSLSSGKCENSDKGLVETKSLDQGDGGYEETESSKAPVSCVPRGQRSKGRVARRQISVLLHTAEGDSGKGIAEECQSPCKCRKRKCKHKTDSGDMKDIPAGRSLPPRRSRRVCNATSNLRGKINDSLFQRCFLKIWEDSPEEKRNLCTYMECVWFSLYTNDQWRKKVLMWIKKLNIFSKEYVLVPIVLWSHWYLVIFCHLGESPQSKTRTPCILLLNSLRELDWGLEPLIRRLVIDIYETEERPADKKLINKIPLLVPKVPQQTNSEECGIFVLHYTNLFLKSAPENFSISDGYPYFMKDDWFVKEELEGFYRRLESFEAESRDPDE
ncbi:putative ubiquitin-like-specific protease 2A [Forsythia ovata]|uniref:Ubiquitin-like-specific protease 2A n=1 Tax=Forsythia ovata TaxID=205694 RepID=A0ABD1VF69_9LAMI